MSCKNRVSGTILARRSCYRDMATDVLICAAGLGLSSLIGSGLGALVRNIHHRWNDIFLGYCAGMMLAASLVCLIMPGVRMVPLADLWQPLLGVVAGVAFISLLDYFTPHLHSLCGLEDTEHHPCHMSTDRVLLFVLAIALHKFPEGLATGISVEGTDPGNSFALTLAIALQNIPEGMVVVTPLILIGVRAWRIVLISLAVALLEVAGVFAGYLLGDISSLLLPALLGLAGGAMLYVISDEMIPETHSHGFEKASTYALIAGVMTMLVIEKLNL